MGDIEPGIPPDRNTAGDQPAPGPEPSGTEPAGAPGGPGLLGDEAAQPTLPIPATPEWQPPPMPPPGQPPAWQPPYGQQPYGPPTTPGQPHAWQPPYGQQPYGPPTTPGQPPAWQPPYGQQPYGPAYPPPGDARPQPPYPYPPPSYWPAPPGTLAPGQEPYGPAGPASPPPKPPRTRSQKVGLASKAVLAAALVIALIFIASDALGAFRSTQQGPRVPTGTDSGLQGAAITPPAGTAPVLDIRAALRAVEPGVVDITTSSSNGLAQNQGQGTGVVLDTRGDVLTNAHVVAGASRVSLQIFGDPAVYQATVLAADKTADVAVVKIQNPPSLTPVPLGRSSGIRVGDPVVAVGNALGLTPGGPTVTSGIIAGLNRTLDTSAGNSATEHLTGLIQTDAALNPGNSGGPLIDANNQVIGMNTAIAASSNTQGAQDVGFSIPIDVAMQLVPSLEKGTVPASNQGFLGVDIEDVATGGAKIVAVTPHSPAASAGLRAGDVITGLNGQPVATSGDAASVIGSLGPGAKLTITFTRGSATHKVTVTLATRPATTSLPTISP